MPTPDILHEDAERNIFITKGPVAHVFEKPMNLGCAFIRVAILYYLEEFIEFYLATAIFVNKSHHILNILSRICESKSNKRSLKFGYSYRPRHIVIE